MKNLDYMTKDQSMIKILSMLIGTPGVPCVMYGLEWMFTGRKDKNGEALAALGIGLLLVSAILWWGDMP